jgi:hypothetical protein
VAELINGSVAAITSSAITERRLLEGWDMGTLSLRMLSTSSGGRHGRSQLT